MRLGAIIILGLAVVSASTLLGLDHASAQTRCTDEVEPPTVSVTLYPRNVAFSTAKSRDDLTHRFNESNATKLHPNARALGLTGGTLASETQFKHLVVTRPSGAICGYLREVSITLGIQTLEVFVARDYAPGSCEYEAVVRHEAEHVDIHYRTLDEYAPRIARELAAGLQRRPWTMNFSVEEVENTFRERTDIERLSSFKRMMRTLDRRHGAIDTPESYRRTRMQCSNW